MRAYHSFPVHGSLVGALSAGLVIGVPLVLLFAFSAVSGIALHALFFDLGSSVMRLLAAFVLSACIGWGIAVFLGQSKIGSGLLPVFDVLQSMPGFALLPIGITLFGKTDITIIIFLVLAIVWPIVFTTLSSIKQTERTYAELIKVSRLRGIPYIKHYLLPMTLPGLVTGSIIGIGEGWEALIATEIITTAPSGLGAFFSHVAGNPTLTLFGVLIFLSIIFAINKLLWLPLLTWSSSLSN